MKVSEKWENLGEKSERGEEKEETKERAREKDEVKMCWPRLFAFWSRPHSPFAIWFFLGFINRYIIFFRI